MMLLVIPRRSAHQGVRPVTDHREWGQPDEGLATDMALLDELVNTVARREQVLSEEDLDRVLGVTSRVSVPTAGNVEVSPLPEHVTTVWAATGSRSQGPGFPWTGG